MVINLSSDDAVRVWAADMTVESEDDGGHKVTYPRRSEGGFGSDDDDLLEVVRNNFPDFCAKAARATEVHDTQCIGYRRFLQNNEIYRKVVKILFPADFQKLQKSCKKDASRIHC